MNKICLAFLSFLLLGGVAEAKVDLVSLPARDTVQLTIYNFADLTLARESRFLTLKRGPNRLQFSWADTLIDPTSLELLPGGEADKIRVTSLTYPPRVQNLGLWEIQSDLSGQAPVEISYLTSGLSWRAFYMGTMDPDETSMRLQGYVRVTNNSGEDYPQAQVRLIVGQVHLLDRIAELARRQYPYGRPGPVPILTGAAKDEAEELAPARVKRVMAMAAAPPRPKEIRKEGLSEYFLYTIEGTEDIPQGWSKRLPSFEAAEVPVINLYKYEEEKYGRRVRRFLSFKNDQAHHLGRTPIPGGRFRVYRQVDEEGRLAYQGDSQFKYIPVDEDVELDLGPSDKVVVEPSLMDYREENHLFDHKGNLNGWDEVRKYRMLVKNTRPVPVTIEIKRHLPTAYWKLQDEGEIVRHEKVDFKTVKFTLTIPERSSREFHYQLLTYHGRRADYARN